MSLSLAKENYLLHKLQSLTGIVPVGFYMLQHLTLNSFSLGGPAQFNAVIGFFEGVPMHILLLVETVFIWIPLLFHAVYGLFIVGRAKPNFIGTKYGWSQNRMYTLQRWTGVFLFFFLIFHVLSTTGVKYATGSAEGLYYAAWRARLTSYGYAFLILYLVGVLAASYHLAYGIWNFCIRWGITISDTAQIRVQKFAFVFFVLVTLLGWAALFGFLRPGTGAAIQTSVPAPVRMAALTP